MTEREEILAIIDRHLNGHAGPQYRAACENIRREIERIPTPAAASSAAADELADFHLWCKCTEDHQEHKRCKGDVCVGQRDAIAAALASSAQMREALEAFVEAYGSQDSSTKGLDDAAALARSALIPAPAASPPSREAAFNAVSEILCGKSICTDVGDWLCPQDIDRANEMIAEIVVKVTDLAVPSFDKSDVAEAAETSEGCGDTKGRFAMSRPLSFPANQKTRCESCNLLEPCADPQCPNALSSQDHRAEWPYSEGDK
jgi:hypothetical protein